MNINQPEVILRRHQVQAATGLSRSTIYLRITQGLWPRPVNLGARSVGWPAGEVATLNAARIAGRSDDEIRKWVVHLEARRLSADTPLFAQTQPAAGLLPTAARAPLPKPQGRTGTVWEA
jgi:prophage regulatory protein